MMLGTKSWSTVWRRSVNNYESIQNKCTYLLNYSSYTTHCQSIWLHRILSLEFNKNLFGKFPFEIWKEHIFRLFVKFSREIKTDCVICPADYWNAIFILIKMPSIWLVCEFMRWLSSSFLLTHSACSHQIIICPLLHSLEINGIISSSMHILAFWIRQL